MYSPTLGRFITKDPIGFQAGDENLYRFVENNPVNALDPSGLQKSNPGINFDELTDPRVLAFLKLHGPVPAVQIKKIWGRATDFAVRMEKKYKDCYPDMEGYLITNAAQHLFVQSALTARFGPDVAKMFGNVHEEANGQEGQSIDNLIDQYHNKIGRELGSQYWKAFEQWGENDFKPGIPYFWATKPGSKLEFTETVWELIGGEIQDRLEKEIEKIIAACCKKKCSSAGIGVGGPAAVGLEATCPLILTRNDSRITTLPLYRPNLPFNRKR